MIFSDKTGTLTTNQMTMKKFQINGIKYGDEEDEYHQQDNGVDHWSYQGLSQQCISEIQNSLKLEGLEQAQTGVKGQVTSFFEILSLCNTVNVSFNPQLKRFSYKSTSPDDLALVYGAQDFAGIQLMSKDYLKKEVKIYNHITKIKKTFKIVAEFPFDSDRKRMSVILKDVKDNQIVIMTKGADYSMIERINFKENDFEELREMLDEDVAQYSKEGLRTLIIAQRFLTRQEYKQLKTDLKRV